MLTHLPSESAYKTELRNAYTDEQLAEMADEAVDQAHGEWSHTDLLLAGLFDALQALAHIQLARGGVQQDPPPPLPRPGVVSRRKRMNPQAVAYLDRIRQVHAAAKQEQEGSP